MFLTPRISESIESCWEVHHGAVSSWIQMATAFPVSAHAKHTLPHTQSSFRTQLSHQSFPHPSKEPRTHLSMPSSSRAGSEDTCLARPVSIEQGPLCSIEIGGIRESDGYAAAQNVVPASSPSSGCRPAQLLLGRQTEVGPPGSGGLRAGPVETEWWSGGRFHQV